MHYPDQPVAPLRRRWSARAVSTPTTDATKTLPKLVSTAAKGPPMPMTITTAVHGRR